MRKFQQEKGAQTALLFRYEDIASDSESVLKHIIRFIGRRVPSEFLNSKPVRSGTLDKWRVQLSHSEVRRVEEICYDQMKTFGYEPELVHRARKIGPVLYASYMLQHAFRLLTVKNRTRRRKFRDVVRLHTALKYLKLYIKRR